MKPTSDPINLLITDLDNTLYDWVTFFVPSLYAMVEAACALLDVSEDDLLTDLKHVHQHHGSSEHPFALLETELVRKNLSSMSEAERLDYLQPAFYAFNKERKRGLQLYDGVFETLDLLHKRGVACVAYTDARVENSLFRLFRLGLLPVVSRLYAPRHKVSLPDRGRTPQYASSVPQDFVAMLPADDRKPNPQLLLDICRDFGVAPSSTLYIGDSLVRDVYMANRAHVHSGWAKYGTSYDKALWDKLVRATHWTDEDVAREQRLRAEVGAVIPDVELMRFSDILQYFHFEAVPARRVASES